MLVRVSGCEDGVGRLRAISTTGAQVEYFDHPGAGGTIVRDCRVERLRRAWLAPQTRVHFLRGGAWQHGRVAEHETDAGHIEVRLPRRRTELVAETDVVVRWRRRLADATELLADGWVETRRDHDGRSAFVRAYLDRAAAYQGLTAISSSAIEFHAHQAEAVRRVMTDGTPRFLLADEVGLGKTIEAGLLIRQHLLDGNPGGVLVGVPAPLVGQWRAELAEKLQIDGQFAGRCRVVSHEEFDAQSLDDVGFVVVDEAHELVAAGRVEDGRYARTCAALARVDGLLLLSATPLDSVDGLLRLLHVLAPDAYALDAADVLKASLARRAAVAVYAANLEPDDDAVFLKDAVGGLRTALAEDAWAMALLDDVDRAIDGDRARLGAAVAQARAYVADAHRITSRMVRSRRGTGLVQDFPVIGRDEPEPVPAAGAVQAVQVAFADWHEHVQERLQQLGPEARQRLVRDVADVVQALSRAGSALVHAAERRSRAVAGEAGTGEERELLDELARAARERAADCPRTRVAVALALGHLEARRRVAVAAGDDTVAATIEQRLADATGSRSVVRLSDEDPAAAAAFRTASQPLVLVFGPAGEQGQNLQAADVVVNVDLPWDPNVVEQRLGRFDRFGPGDPARQQVVVDDVDTIANAWLDVLRDGFGVFGASIASLQSAVAGIVAPLVEAAVCGGADRLRDHAGEVAQALERELGEVEQAELLDDALTDERATRLADAIEAAEARETTQAWEAAVLRWAAGDGSDASDLRFHHRRDGNVHRFALTPYEKPSAAGVRPSDLPLITWDELHERFAGAFEDGAATGAFSRNTATSRSTRLLGPGDPFVDALWDFTEVDDRGRSFAVWRTREYWKHEDRLAICFDLRVRPDVGAALEDLAGTRRQVAEAALRRRAESYFAPASVRLWFGVGGNVLQHAGLLRVLDAPYSDRSGDRTLRPEAWHRVEDHLGRHDWPSLCRVLGRQARTLALDHDGLRERCAEAAAALRADSEHAAARLAARGDGTERAAEALERSRGETLAAGLEAPLVEVDAAGLVVLSAHALPHEEEGA